jgi:hypothetical protein
MRVAMSAIHGLIVYLMSLRSGDERHTVINALPWENQVQVINHLFAHYNFSAIPKYKFCGGINDAPRDFNYQRINAIKLLRAAATKRDEHGNPANYFGLKEAKDLIVDLIGVNKVFELPSADSNFVAEMAHYGYLWERIS